MVPDPTKRIVTTLFLGTTLSIASVKIVAAVVQEMNFGRRRVGQLIIAAAIVDDTIGWLIIAITIGIGLHGRVEPKALATTLLGVAVFLALYDDGYATDAAVGAAAHSGRRGGA